MTVKTGNLKWLVSCCICFCTCISHARVIEVSANAIVQSIALAIQLADDGDTVMVLPGIYREGNLIVNKRISLIGIDHPILDGENKFEIISVTSDSVLIHGFHFIDSGISGTVDFAGLKIYDASHVVVEENILERTFFGIYSQHAKNCIIKNNELQSFGGDELQCGNGIHCWKCDSMQIIHNTVKNHRDGIYFEFVTNSIIWRNVSEQNVRYGLHFMFSNDDTYVANYFHHNGAGVAVMFSNHVSMLGNHFSQNWGDSAYGILLKEISDGFIIGNQFDENTTGIVMEGANRIETKRNLFSSNGHALRIQASCMDIVLENNEFIANIFDVSTNGSLVMNSFHRNFWDKYEGYDLNRNGLGDVPFHPVSLYGMITEKNPPAMMLFGSFFTKLLDRTERVMPGLTPENLVDHEPRMKRFLM